MTKTRQRWDDGDSDITFAIAAITGAGNVDTGLQTRITAVATDVLNSDDVNPGVGVGPQVSCMVSQAVPNVRVRVNLLANNGIVVSAAPHNVAVLAKGQR